MSPVGGSWITRPRNQLIAGTLIAACIIGAFAFAALGQRAERDRRQDQFNVESIQRDKEIRESQVSVVCSTWDFVVGQTGPVSTEGETRPERLSALARITQGRAVARADFAKKMFDGKAHVDVFKECAPLPEGT